MKILFDGMNIAYRCYAIYDKKQELSTSEGEPTGILYGFVRTLNRWRKKYPQSTLHIAWDSPEGKKWRQEKYSDYKADREREDDSSFSSQLERLKEEFLPALGVTQYFSKGEEADDIIGTLADKWSDQAVVIVSNDHDFLQLVDSNTVLIKPDMSREYDVEEVEEEYGVPPKWVVPFRALDGDSSDNLPGLPYFRKKIIAKLVEEFEGDLGSLYEGDLPDHLTEKETEKLDDFEKQAFLNEELMELKSLDSYEEVESSPDREKISSLCEDLEFKSLEEDLPEFAEKEGFVKTD